MGDIYIRVARRRRQGQGGFTLIELLVVIAVLAILAAIVIFNVTGVSNKGQTAACQTDLKSVQTASDAYINDNPGTNPTTLSLAKLVPVYLHTGPTDLGTLTWDANDTVTSNKC